MTGVENSRRDGKFNMYSRGNNPIVVGEVNAKNNLTLTNTWKEERRQRDNGANCATTLQWDCQLKKREVCRPQTGKIYAIYR